MLPSTFLSLNFPLESRGDHDRQDACHGDYLCRHRKSQDVCGGDCPGDHGFQENYQGEHNLACPESHGDQRMVNLEICRMRRAARPE